MHAFEQSKVTSLAKIESDMVMNGGEWTERLGPK